MTMCVPMQFYRIYFRLNICCSLQGRNNHGRKDVYLFLLCPPLIYGCQVRFLFLPFPDQLASSSSGGALKSNHSCFTVQAQLEMVRWHQVQSMWGMCYTLIARKRLHRTNSRAYQCSPHAHGLRAWLPVHRWGFYQLTRVWGMRLNRWVNPAVYNLMGCWKVVTLL